MGCDFYIDIYLEIHHINGISYYELPFIRGYYCELDCGIYDSDDDENDHYYNSIEYETLYKNMKKICLTPRKPVVIYNNNSFISQKLEMKYLPFIQNKINKQCDKDTGKFNSIDEVIKVIKKEKRYAPFENNDCNKYL